MKQEFTVMMDKLKGLYSRYMAIAKVYAREWIALVIKTQNDLFIQVFINYAIKQKNVFFSLTPEKKMQYIENVIQRDIKFRNSLKGMIIALFTLEEYAEYIRISSNLNKRMMNMLVERLKSQIQLIEQ